MRGISKHVARSPMSMPLQAGNVDLQAAWMLHVQRVGSMEMPFEDRADAGRQLAAKLTGYRDQPTTTVLALPRGGVPVGYEVAKALGSPLDVLIVRRLSAPANNGMTIGAVASGGIRVLDEDLVHALSLPADLVRAIVEREEAEVAWRERLYHDCHPSRSVLGRTVILVDDGMATGASMRAAVAAVQEKGPSSIIVAVPVASYATCAELAAKVHEIVYCYVRDPVHSVTLWYRRYPPISDEEACSWLRRSADDHRKARTESRFGQEQYREAGTDATEARHTTQEK
jgi:putative phosphoribosyl transferase